MAKITCDEGFYLTGSRDLHCLGSDTASSGAHWGAPLTGEGEAPTCAKCLSDCKTCSEGTSCTACAKASDVWSPTAKKCVLNKPRSCKTMLDLKQLPAIPKGKVRLDRDVRLWPDVANKPDQVRPCCRCCSAALA